MASLSRKLRERNSRLVDRAKAGLKKNSDGSYVDLELRDALAELLPRIDPDKAARDKAAAIIESLTKQEDADDDDAQYQLQLGGESYNYNPFRWVKDAAGNIIEEENASVTFLLADLARSAENLSRASVWNNRKARKLQHFQPWVDAERAKGRPITELTWGNCAKETGILWDRKGRAAAI